MNNDLSQKTYEQYGPIMGGKDLWKALGYKTFAAFARALDKSTIGVKVFRIEGRRGWFAMTEDVVNWLNQLKEQYQLQLREEVPTASED